MYQTKSDILQWGENQPNITYGVARIIYHYLRTIKFNNFYAVIN